MLFVELALIRWTGSNILYLSYFSNFILLGSFLGIGIGFLRSRSTWSLWPWAPLGLAFLVAFTLLFPVEVDRSGSTLIYFGHPQSTGLPIWATLPIVFVTVALSMAMIGDGVARTFVRLEPLDAYRMDILGSIAGIGAFTLVSFWRLPPIAWGAITTVVFLILYGRSVKRLVIPALIIMLGFLSWESFKPDTRWSPYYKVSLTRPSDDSQWPVRVNVNGIPHQDIEPSTIRKKLEPIYFLPYSRIQNNPLEDVLIIGAGTGSDVAVALAEGADHIDAVEIDPVIYDTGKRLHPDNPYQDPRVDVFIDDGRAFLERTDREYDLILFALPDSLTLVSGQSSLRLESFLFTQEALAETARHLKTGGAFAMYNFYREPWLIDRLAGTLANAYGRPPCLDNVAGGGGLALLSVSNEAGALKCDVTWPPLPPPPEPAVDDWPFVYLINKQIPLQYLLAIALILISSLLAVRVLSGPLRAAKPYIDLFFMGAAFLLLETKNVVQFALLFGTTWVVNAVAFAGILLSVYAAIEVARRVEFRRPKRLYAILLASILVSFAIPHSALLRLAIPGRIAAAVVLAFTPVFLANLVFSNRFKQAGASGVAFGANLLGAMVGGLLEYSALLVGYRVLLIGAAILYGLAFFFADRYPETEKSTQALVDVPATT
jgi:SAM-dependent methyltransferase